MGEDGIIRSHAFLQAVERSGLNDCRYWYVMAFEGERLVAHCSAFTISFYLDIFVAGAAGRAAASLHRIRLP